MNAYDKELITPAPQHGRLRITARRLWSLIGVLWALAMVNVVLWPNWPSWTLAAGLALVFIFTVAVSWVHPREDDRAAIRYATAVTLFLAGVITAAWFLGLLLGGGK